MMNIISKREDLLATRSDKGSTRTMKKTEHPHWCAFSAGVLPQNTSRAVKTLSVTCANRPKLVVQLRRFLIIDVNRRPNLASQCMGISLRSLQSEWEKAHDYRPLLAESFHDTKQHTGTLYKTTNWTPLGLTKGFARHRADYYQDLKSPKQLWVIPLQKTPWRFFPIPQNYPRFIRKP